MTAKTSLIALCAIALAGCGANGTAASTHLVPVAGKSSMTAGSSHASIHAQAPLNLHVHQITLTDPTSVTAGPDGNIWVATNALTRLTPNGHRTDFNVVGSVGAMTTAFGKVWFFGGTFPSPYVANIDTTSKQITRFDLPPGHCTGDGITGGPDGNIWFPDNCGGSIMRVTPAGVMTSFPMPRGLFVNDIISGPDGKLWFTADDGGNFGKVDMLGNVSIISLPLAFFPQGLVIGPDGNVYIYDTYHAFLYRVTPQNAFVKFQAALPKGRDVRVAVGPDKAIWMLSLAGQVQRFDPATGIMSGVMTLPNGPGGPAAGATGIVTGADGDLYMTAGSANYIGVVEL